MSTYPNSTQGPAFPLMLSHLPLSDTVLPSPSTTSKPSLHVVFSSYKLNTPNPTVHNALLPSFPAGLFLDVTYLEYNPLPFPYPQ